MKTRSEIEQAIKELPTAEAHQLAGWLNEYLEGNSFLASRNTSDLLDDAWDRQMQTDLSTGKLDKFIAKAESEIEANQMMLAELCKFSLDHLLSHSSKLF